MKCYQKMKKKRESSSICPEKKNVLLIESMNFWGCGFKQKFTSKAEKYRSFFDFSSVTEIVTSLASIINLNDDISGGNKK